MPGREWAKKFLERHRYEIRNRQAANISVKRAAVSEKIVDLVYLYLGQIV